MTHEQTIRAAVTCKGIGLHSGAPVNLRILPAPAGTGIVFHRTDLDGFAIEASGRNVARVSYATSLMKKGVLISTTEHLLSAFTGVGIDNAIVELDNLELPILDGSARPFVEMIQEAGIRKQRKARTYLRVVRDIELLSLIHISRQNRKAVLQYDFEVAKDKVLMGVERKSLLLTDEEKKNTAYHEAGHALVAAKLPHADPVHKVTIIPRGMALGLTMQLPVDDRHNYYKNYLDTQIAILMGGRIAEEIFLSQMSTEMCIRDRAEVMKSKVAKASSLKRVMS